MSIRSTSDCISILQTLVDRIHQGNTWTKNNDTFVQEECQSYSGLILSANSLINGTGELESLKRANEFRLQDLHRYDVTDPQYSLWRLVGVFLHAAPNGSTFNLEKSKEELVKLLVSNSVYRKTYPLIWELSKITLQNLENGESLISWRIEVSALADVFKEVETVRMMKSVWASQTKGAEQPRMDCGLWPLVRRLIQEAWGSLFLIFLLFICPFLMAVQRIRKYMNNNLNSLIDRIFPDKDIKCHIPLMEILYACYMILIAIGNFILSRHTSNDIFRLTGPSITSDCQINWIDIWIMIDLIMIMIPWVFMGVEWLKIRKGVKECGILVALVLSLPPISILYPIILIADIKNGSIADATMLLSVLKDSLLVFLSILWAALVEKALIE